MENKPTSEDFGELLRLYSLPKNKLFQESFIEKMRLNLKERNNGESEVVAWNTRIVINLDTCDLTELIHAHVSLKRLEPMSLKNK